METLLHKLPARAGGTLIFQCNLRCDDVPLLKLRNTFLEEILQIWTQINFTSEEPVFYNACIWYNSMVRINKRPVFYQSWFNAGIKYVEDLMDSNSNFLRYNVFLSNYGIKANFLTYSGVLSALVNYKKCFSQNHSSKDKRAEEVKAALKGCKGTYKMLIQRIASLLTRSEGKWLTEANLFGYSSINWEKTYSFPCLCTKETKLRVFQFKFLHRKNCNE